jgi:hypothetical protein
MSIDLNAARKARAARREGGSGPIPVHLGKDTYNLPREVPAELLDRLLDPEVEIARLLILAVRQFQNSRSEDMGEVIVDILSAAPDLPFGIVRAIKDAVRFLFGDEQWAAFEAQKPSLEDEWELLQGLVKTYGVSLGEAFASSKPSDPAGATSKPISNVSTTSMPEASGPTPAPPDSSDSGG